MKKHPRKSDWNILQRYEHHLREVVGLTPKTCQNHLRDVRSFLEAAKIGRTAELAAMKAVQITCYLSARSVDYTPASLRQVAGSLRHFLRFAQQQGWTGHSLGWAVPKIANRAHYDLPAYLSEPQLELLLASWDQSTAEGQRDRALALCLARLGLRAGELAALLLEDLNWRQGRIRLSQSKNGHAAELPLLSEVCEAMADYLRTGRPACSHRQVFVFDQPPRPMTAQAISRVIARALQRCGIEVPRPGAHLLRHTLASHLVQREAGLKEVADLLRHRHLNSASVYAHVDLPHLRLLAQPWPQEVTR